MEKSYHCNCIFLLPINQCRLRREKEGYLTALHQNANHKLALTANISHKTVFSGTQSWIMERVTLFLKGCNSKYLGDGFHEGKQNHPVRKFTLFLKVKLSIFSWFLTPEVSKKLVGFIYPARQNTIFFIDGIS